MHPILTFFFHAIFSELSFKKIAFFCVKIYLTDFFEEAPSFPAIVFYIYSKKIALAAIVIDIFLNPIAISSFKFFRCNRYKHSC